MCLELALFQNALAARECHRSAAWPLATNRPYGPASLQPRSAEDLSFLCGSPWHTVALASIMLTLSYSLPNRGGGLHPSALALEESLSYQ